MHSGIIILSNTGGLLVNLFSKLVVNFGHGLSLLCYLKAQNNKLKQSKLHLSVVSNKKKISQVLWSQAFSSWDKRVITSEPNWTSELKDSQENSTNFCLKIKNKRKQSMKFNSRALAKYVQCLSFNSQNWRRGGVDLCWVVLVLRQALHSFSLPILHYRRFSLFDNSLSK